MSTHSAHNGHNFIWRLIHWDWQSQRDTGEVLAVPPQPFRIVHQDEARRMSNRFLQWCDEQPVLNPRLVEQTTPKLRERAGHIQEVTPQIAEYRPPQFTPRNGLLRIDGPRTPIPEAHKQAEQVQALNPTQLPPWLQDLRDNSLPIQRMNEEKPAELMTLRKDSLPLPPFLGFSDPDVVPDLPTEKPTQEQADAWLNSAVLPTLEVDHNALAASDKSNVFEVTETDCAPDLTDEDPEGTAQASALWKLRHCERVKGLE